MNLGHKVSELEKYQREVEEEIEGLYKENQAARERLQVWNEEYLKLAWYVRWFQMIPVFKKRISQWIYSFLEERELDILSRNMSFEQIQEQYIKFVETNDNKIFEFQKQYNNLDKEKQLLIDQLELVKRKKEELSNLFIKLRKSQELKFDSNRINTVFEEFNVSALNDLLDEIRYIEFWLAVHYYECKWLCEEYPLSDKQRNTTYKSALEKRYSRLAMLTPCMVMTFYTLPKQFYAYDKNPKKCFFMHNYIDLLIVDEAGQISPEIAAGAFSLAKKAIVVGDEKQIPPVWNTTRALDIAMAKTNGMIIKNEEFKNLEENGLNCSESNLMKLACRSSAYDKYGKGLFLSEHRRCYNEIIEYCNTLVYGGHLEPLRGTVKKESNCLDGYLPPMGHKPIDCSYSEKVGTSRRNMEEAKGIVDWIKKNYSDLLKKYDKTFNNGKDVLGVITPFKSQSILIKKILNRECPNYAELIDVGTVHTFQGAERNVIFFSSVYGSKDGCYFINANDSLMNVAVSRAKDSFLVFGDRGCLEGS